MGLAIAATMGGGPAATLAVFLSGLRQNATARALTMRDSAVTTVRLRWRGPDPGAAAAIPGFAMQGTGRATGESGSTLAGPVVGAGDSGYRPPCATSVSALRLACVVPDGRNRGAYWPDGMS